MVIGKKFWPLKTISTITSYNPGDRPGISFGGIVDGTTSITNVDSTTVTNIASLIGSSTAGVGISGQWIDAGTCITVATGTTLTLSKASSASADGAISSLRYWDLDYPSVAGVDSPIQAVFCNVSSKLEFYDQSGKLVTFAAGKLVVGAVYYFEILSVKTSTSGDYIGYAAH